MIVEMMTHLWQSTLFAAAAGLLTIAFRKNRAKVRFWLWLSASLKFFVPFAVLIGLGSNLGWKPAAPQIAAPAVTFAVEYVAEPFSATLSPAPIAPRSTDWMPIVMLSVWACGFLAIVLIRLRLWFGIRRSLRASTPLEIPAAVGIRSAPGLLEPGVVGLMKPVLLLPEGIVERLTPSELEAVLAHELCHVRRRDNLFATIHMIVEAIFWFHPLVWWIGARMVEERERACDEEVLNLGNQPRIYADAILSVCKLYVESPLVCVSGVTGSDIKRRIEAIMRNRTGRGLGRAKKLLLASAGFVALAIPVMVGVVIGIGHAAVIHAQSPINQPIVQTTPVTPIQVAQVGPPAQTKRPAPSEFDAASIKPYKPDNNSGGEGSRSGGAGAGPGGGRLQFRPGRVLSVAMGRGGPGGVTTRRIVLEAYGLSSYQLSGGPAWLDSDVLQLEAKAADTSANENQLRLMLQTMLAKRFKLVAHHETRQMPVYILTVGKNGAKLPDRKNGLDDGDEARAKAMFSGPNVLAEGGMDEMTYTVEPMSRFIDEMNTPGPMGRQSHGLDRPVLDKTGLHGTYLFLLRVPLGQDYKTAVEEQLGLKFEPQKAPVDILVIDQIEKPEAN
jgi:uncharacterized protein (TIGR03435 family)